MPSDGSVVTSPTSSDAFLARIERDAVRAAIGAALVAAAIARHWNPPVAVLGGAVLAGLSYRGIKAGTMLLARGGDGEADGAAAGRRDAAVALFKLFTRYAILTLAAYAMMVRLRLHPGWMLAGASALVLAIGAEAIRVARGSTDRRDAP